MTTRWSSENVTNPRLKALSYTEFKQTPFRGSARRDSLTESVFGSNRTLDDLEIMWRSPVP